MNSVYDIKAQIENEKQVNKDKTIQKQIKIDKKIYRVYGKFVNSRNKEKKNKKEYMMVLYFLDETEKCKLQEEYENSKTCIGMIMVDNYEETFQLLESEEVAQCKAEIDKIYL